MSLLPVFKWLGDTTLGIAINKSKYGFAGIEMVHLLALSLLGGSILITDLCALGLIRLRQPLARIARDLTPPVVGSLTVLVASGVLLVADGPLRYYANAAFRAKMLLLGIAVLFYLTLHRRALAGESAPALRRTAAIVSLGLWFGVALAGRAIGIL